MLNINNVHATVDDKEILKGLSLDIGDGEVHAIMGPNGTGKSTLSHVLAGRAGYDVTKGSITYQGQDLLEMEVDERAKAGIFLSFQYPVEIPGVTSMNFLKSSVNAVRTARGEDELDSVTFLKEVRQAAKKVAIDDKLLKRSVNQGFSGGEKKRFETLQILMLQPNLIILDETDSGLDIDALKTVATAINALKDGKRSMIVITHYQRLLNYIEPDKVHILNDGQIIKSGDKSLAETLEKEGYEAFGVTAHDGGEAA